jgi:hypothetical protein
MKTNLKLIAFLFVLFATESTINAQSVPTLELQRAAMPIPGANYGFGVSSLPVISAFQNDAINNNVFTPNSPLSTLTVSFRNQVFNNLNYGTANFNNGLASTFQTTGLVFGAEPSLSTPVYSGDKTQGANPGNRYDNLGFYSSAGGPTFNMFTSNPKATGAQLGTGIQILGASAKPNGGIGVFTTAQALFNDTITFPRGSRVYFGDIVFKFSQPVLNPVLHFAGLGGSYRYLPLGSIDKPENYLSTFFSSELEMINTGYTSTLMSGNSFIQLSGNNILNNNDANPNGNSTLNPDEIFNNLGAATGSVRVNGVVTEVAYRVYLQGGSASQFAWSTKGLDAAGNQLITDATKDPFTGDIWWVSASYEKPTQQVSGNIFIDKDGLTDNNINQSGGVANPATNLGGSLFANLVNTNGDVVASIPVGNDGTYLFDNVPVGIYCVQLTTNASSGTYALPVPAPATILPTNWANTGEFVGNTVGSDGTVNGKSSNVVVNSSDIKVDINFGIERLPESISYESFIAKPLLNAVLTLNGPLPVLSGSDPEDQPIVAPLTSKSLRIDVLPTNAQLLYAGSPISVGQVISNYNPALLQVVFTDPGAGVSGIVSFKYSFVDAAGLADPTPATYTIRWPAGGPLPIILSDFSGVKNNCNASFNWKTASELDSEKFELEFSTTTNTAFETVGTIGAAGNSTTSKSYQFNYALESGVSYYFRLKMFKKDGTFTYSQIIPISCLDAKSEISIKPNPTNTGVFQIKGMPKGKNTVSIYSNDGKLLRTENVVNNKDIIISNLAAGTYVIRILNENGTASVERLIKY